MRDVVPAVRAGAYVVLGASVFDLGRLTVGDPQAALAEAGHPVG